MSARVPVALRGARPLRLAILAAVLLGAHPGAAPAAGNTESKAATGGKVMVPAARPATEPASNLAHAPGAAPQGKTVGALPTWQAPPSYSVDMVVKSKDESFVIRRSVDGARVRSDFDIKGQKMSMVELGDEDGTTLNIMPEQKKVMKQTRKGMAAMAGAAGAKEEAATAPQGEAANTPPAGKLEYLGREALNGHEADKYRCSAEGQVALAWIDPATQSPLRMESGESSVEWKNFKAAPQPASLFEAPKDFEVMDMDAMMKQAMGGMAGAPAMAGGGASVPGMSGLTGMGMGGIANQMTGRLGGQMGAGFGGALGSHLGAAFGGPIGAMAGQYLGGKVGEMVGRRAAQAVTPGK
jgi:hypothetical protein